MSVHGCEATVHSTPLYMSWFDLTKNTERLCVVLGMLAHASQLAGGIDTPPDVTTVLKLRTNTTDMRQQLLKKIRCTSVNRSPPRYQRGGGQPTHREGGKKNSHAVLILHLKTPATVILSDSPTQPSSLYTTMGCRDFRSTVHRRRRSRSIQMG